jgi:GNAT superfamily N-acetyltransferase
VTGAERHAAASIRKATLDDIPDIRSILAEHGNDGPIATVDIVGPYVRHLVSTARALVANEGAHVVGFGSAVDTGGGGRHLTDLFVRKDRVGQGIGRTLLDQVFAGTTRRTTFASDDQRAMPVYIRAGMAPLWPCLYLTGHPTMLPDSDRGLIVEAADAARLAGLERDWTGVDRSVDHAFWATQAEADPFVIIDGGEIVAGGYGRARQKGPTRFVDRLVIRPGQDPRVPIYAALRRAARGGPIDAAIPGPSPAVRPLLEAGFRIDDRDTFMASGPDLVDPTRLLPNPGML